MPDKKCVLIIEDHEEILRAILTNIIKQRKDVYTPLVGVDGYEALDTMHHKDVDLLVLDLVMQNLDGLQLCRQLKSEGRLKDLPIIISSAYLDDDCIEALKELGIKHFMKKPYAMEELLEKMDEVLLSSH